MIRFIRRNLNLLDAPSWVLMALLVGVLVAQVVAVLAT